MEQVTIVKIGGKVIDNPEELNAFLDAFTALPGQKLLVHGGGTMATQLADRMGVKTQMVDGRRITDKESLKLVTMVYAGLVNKNLVAALQARNVDALGICGADMNLLKAQKREHPTIDYGYVGDISKVNANALKSIIDSNKVVVVAPLTHDGQGQLLNTNADTIATELAIALSKIYSVKLVYSFEKTGVLTDPENESTLLTQIDKMNYELLKSNGTIVQGMIPKTHNAFHAYDNGVEEVIIGNLVAMTNNNSPGTKIVDQVDANL